jgi:hypothetical protein
MLVWLNVSMFTVVSKHFIVDVALGRVVVATEGRTSQLEGSDGILRDHAQSHFWIRWL